MTRNVVYILTLLLTASRAALYLIPYPATRSQSNGLAHRVGTRDIVWLLATLSVQLYFPCTPSSQGVEGSLAAANLLGLSLSPFPLFLPQVLFSLCPVLGLPWKPAAGPDAGSRLRLNLHCSYYPIISLPQCTMLKSTCSY